jgi:hypothetical protein
VCGDDGCGGSCGTCGANTTCDATGACCYDMNVACAYDSQCCSGVCSLLRGCTNCLTSGESCAKNSDCCGGVCNFGTCS